MFFAESRAALRRYLEQVLDGLGLDGVCPFCLDEGLRLGFCPACGKWDLRDEDELEDAANAAGAGLEDLIETEEED